MIKRMLTAASVTLILSSGFAQTNTVYLELFGNALVGSINYDRMVTDNVSVRVGYGSMSTTSSTYESGLMVTEDVGITMIPIIGNYLLGEGNHKLEVGGGIVMVTVDYSGNVEDIDFTVGAEGSIFTGNVGYRYQKPDGGIFFKASLCPFFGDGMMTWFGLGLGYSF